MEAVLGFVPEEEREKYSALTGQSLFYFGEGKSLRHKILAIAEEEGAEKAGYALKLLQSEGELSIASTGKDPQTGRLVTQEYRVEGPVMIFLTTTAIEIDEELLNRCLVLTVDESREQTRRIHELQRRASTLDGILASRRKPKALKVHRNAQRLLRPLLVHNPYAARLTFLDEKTRMRRDHVKYLKLIEAIALLFQYQREVKSADGRRRGRRVRRSDARRRRPRQPSRLRGPRPEPRRAAAADAAAPRPPRRPGHVRLREAGRRAGGPALLAPGREDRDRLGRHAAARSTSTRLVGARVRPRPPWRPGPELRLRAPLARRREGRLALPSRPPRHGRPRRSHRREASSATTTETSRGEEGHLAGGSRPHRGAFAGGVAG